MTTSDVFYKIFFTLGEIKVFLGIPTMASSTTTMKTMIPGQEIYSSLGRNYMNGMFSASSNKNGTFWIVAYLLQPETAKRAREPQSQPLKTHTKVVGFIKCELRRLHSTWLHHKMVYIHVIYSHTSAPSGTGRRLLAHALFFARRCGADFAQLSAVVPRMNNKQTRPVLSFYSTKFKFRRVPFACDKDNFQKRFWLNSVNKEYRNAAQIRKKYKNFSAADFDAFLNLFLHPTINGAKHRLSDNLSKYPELILPQKLYKLSNTFVKEGTSVGTGLFAHKNSHDNGYVMSRCLKDLGVTDLAKDVKWNYVETEWEMDPSVVTFPSPTSRKRGRGEEAKWASLDSVMNNEEITADLLRLWENTGPQDHPYTEIISTRLTLLHLRRISWKRPSPKKRKMWVFGDGTWKQTLR